MKRRVKELERDIERASQRFEFEGSIIADSTREVESNDAFK